MTGANLVRHEWSPETFGLPRCSVDDLKIDSPAESAARIREILAGTPGPSRNIVLANAAAALYAAQHTSDLKSAVAQAAAAIDSGRVRELLDQLVQLTNRLAPPS